MPELPDVENFCRYLKSTSLHQKITDVKVENKKVLQGVSPNKLTRSLKGSQMENVDRHGKYAFARLDSEQWLVLHFGMTGYLHYYKDDQQDDHCRVRLDFKNGYHLDYVSQRMLGKVTVADSKEKFIQQQDMGPDALEIDYEAFEDYISGSRSAVKSALMKQERISGIGNIYSDEILYHAKIHPAAKCSSLEEKDIKHLYKNMNKVLEKATERKADPNQMPRTYLLPHRSKEGKCPRCDGRIKTAKITGRTAYFCPGCQKK